MAKGKYENILCERMPLKVEEQYMGLITLNRPQEMNPLDGLTGKELGTALEDLSTDKKVRVIAFTGAGKAFSAGGDLKGYLTLQRDEEGFMKFLDDGAVMFGDMQYYAQPVIALVNGFCVAGGIELLLGCDFAYAAESAKIGDGHVNFGQVGGGGSQVRLPKRILPARAKELLFTGKLLSAREALEWGLVNSVVPDDKLIETGLEFANIIASKSPLGIKLIKQLCAKGVDMTERDMAFLETRVVHHYCLTSHDAREGLEAFSEKRQPKFEGR